MNQTIAVDSQSPSETVIEAVADAEDVPPIELDPPLFDVVDPDALDHLFANTNSSVRVDGQVSFNYNGYRVFIGEDGHVSLEPHET